jgi:hypothetical protein
MENSGSPIEPQAGIASSPRARPGSVTILALGVLIITVINLIRLILSITYWDFLDSWPGVSPLYVVSTGFIWALTGSLLLWGLWRAKNWAPRLMQAVALTYALYYWLDSIFLMDHPISGAMGAQRALLPVNWQFAVGVTVVCLVYTAWTLRRPKVRVYFGLDESKTGEDQTISDNPG